MGSTDSMDKGQETWLRQDDVGCTMGSIGGTLNSDTHISMREGRGIICAITCHSTKIAKTLEVLANFKFVLWEDTSEPIDIHDHIIARKANWLPGGGHP